MKGLSFTLKFYSVSLLKNSLWVGMLLNSDIFQTNQSLFLLPSAACSEEKQQISIN
jgi:hypothetical protein